MGSNKRVIFEVTPEALERITQLKKSIGASTNADLIRYSLGLLECVEQYRKDNYSIQLKKENEVVNIVFPVSVN